MPRGKLREIVRKPWPVVVIGAGPAGSTAAIHLAHKGHDLLLLDREAFPREKVCGDALLPDAVRCLERLGIYDRVAGVSYKTSQLQIFSPSGICLSVPGDYLTLSRSAFDAILVDAAVGSGATLCRAVVRGVRLVSKGAWEISVQETDESVRARIVVIATGANVALLENLAMVTQRRPTAIALRSYVRSTYPLTSLVASFDRAILPGYAWVFPMGGGKFNIGCGVFIPPEGRVPVNLRTLLATFTAHFPIAAELMRQASEVTPLRGATLRSGLRGCRAASTDGAMVVGESLGATLPLSGEGIGKAMETAELAAAVIDAAIVTEDLSVLASYGARLEQALRSRYRAYETAQRWQSFSWLNDLIVRRARTSPYLQAAFTGIVNETVDPDQVFSLRGVWNSLWR